MIAAIMIADNPYQWNGHHPRVSLPRTGPFEKALRQIARGNAFLLGGRGMGKSVFLRQLAARLSEDPQVQVVLCGAPPAPPTFQGALEQIAAALGVAVGPRPDAGRIITSFLEQQPQRRAVVLLFDEMDGYALREGDVPLGRLLFNHLEAVSRELSGRLRVFAAGGLGVFTLRDLLGSGFLSRAARLLLFPFTEAEAAQLARPFAERGAELSPEVQKALHLASGGIPALLAYGLEALWECAAPTEADVADAYGEFNELHADFLHDSQRSIAHPALSEVPQRVLDLLRRGDGQLSQQELSRACASVERLEVTPRDVLDLLQAAGRIRLTSPVHSDPVLARLVTSILNVQREDRLQDTAQRQLLLDVERILAGVHALSPDFFRPVPGGAKELVPESVFSAFLSMGLGFAGWISEREVQQGQGRTDVKLRHPRFRGTAFLEVKIWGRNNYKEIQEQVARYWSTDTIAAAAIVLTDGDIPDWEERYQHECLSRPALQVERHQPGAPLRGRLTVRATSADGFPVEVEHLLLRIPRKPM